MFAIAEELIGVLEAHEKVVLLCCIQQLARVCFDSIHKDTCPMHTHCVALF